MFVFAAIEWQLELDGCAVLVKQQRLVQRLVVSEEVNDSFDEPLVVVFSIKQCRWSLYATWIRSLSDLSRSGRWAAMLQIMARIRCLLSV